MGPRLASFLVPPALLAAGAAAQEAPEPDPATPYILPMQRMGDGPDHLANLWTEWLASDAELAAARSEYEALSAQALSREPTWVTIGPLPLPWRVNRITAGERAELEGAFAGLTNVTAAHEALAGEYWGELGRVFPGFVVYDQFEESYRTDIQETTGRAASDAEVYAAAAAQPLLQSDGFRTPFTVGRDGLSYIEFDPDIVLPAGVELRVSSSAAESPIVYTGDDLASLGGVVGPLDGDEVSVELYYPPGVRKENFLLLDDVMLDAQTVRPVEPEPTGSAEAAGAETAGPWCGSVDNRAPSAPPDFPWVARMRISTKPLCTAFILTEEIAVSAGHCFAQIREDNEAYNAPRDDYRYVYLEFGVAPSANSGALVTSSPEHVFKIAGKVTCEACDEVVAEPEHWSLASQSRLGADWAVFRLVPLDPSRGGLGAYGSPLGYDFDPDVNSSGGTSIQGRSASVAGYGQSGIGYAVRNFALQSDSGGVQYLSAAASPTGRPALTYTAHTSKGTSGGPIIVNDEGRQRVVGVHTHGFCQADRENPALSTPVNAGMPFWGALLTAIQSR